MHYRNKQPGTAMLIIMGLFAALVVFANAIKPDEPAWVGLFVLAPVALLFSSLTIEIDDENLRWCFGFGFWKKSAVLRDIDTVEAVRTKWYHGLGVRLTSTGWLYNVSGLSAVKVRMNDGREIHLGTNDATGLIAAIHNWQAQQPAVTQATTDDIA